MSDLQTRYTELQIAERVPGIAELTQLDQWVVSKYVERHDKDGNLKYDKPPFSPHTGYQCSHSEPEDWGSYEAAIAILPRFLWLGFVFSEYDPYSGIDLDGCRDPKASKIAPWAQRIIDMCSSYTEISPSGTGVKIFVRGTLPEALLVPMGEHVGMEIYSRQRYFTLTGQHLPGTPTTINDAQ